MKTELKPCPFCGGDADYEIEHFGASIWVMCTVCGISTTRYTTDEIVDGKDGKERATEVWNRRTEVTE